MNYLAHFHLAFPEEELMVGNYMGDGIRGSDFSAYSKAIQRGILLHRFIDTYTDSHPEVAAVKSLFYETQRKYAGVVVDVLFDHVLAKRWSTYQQTDLQSFSDQCYAVIQSHFDVLPVRSNRFFRYMTSQNILFDYQFEDRITEVFMGMDSRTPFASRMVDAIKVYKEIEPTFDRHFNRFYPDLIQATEEWKKTH